MSFTWTSRSRNSGDPQYHRKAAWASNGIWSVGQLFVFGYVTKPVFIDNDIVYGIIGAIIYIFATAEGSVFMMKMLLGHLSERFPRLTKFFKEKEKRRVGSQ
jgi:hypothetical protein